MVDKRASLVQSSNDMSILWRSWIAFTAIIAIVLTVLSVLSILQHNAVLANLVQSRLSVVAQTTSSSFRAIVNLGLPISTVRNAPKILERAKGLDISIKDVYVFNPTGIIVHSTSSEGIKNTSDQILLAQSLSDNENWSVETESEINIGFTISNNTGTPVGAIVVVYPKEKFIEKTDAVAERITLTALILLIILSTVSLVILRLRLNGAIHGISRLNDLLQTFSGNKTVEHDTTQSNQGLTERYGFFSSAIDELQIKLSKADQQYQQATSELLALPSNIKLDESRETQDQSVFATSIPETSLARVFTRQLTPWIAGLVIIALLILGYFAYSEVSRSFEPELAARTKLIGTVANNNIQRAVSSGVPLDSLVGAESYFDELLRNFPEITYFGVSTGRIIIESGSRQKSQFAPARSRKDVPTFPITAGEKQIGYIIIDANPGYFAGQFRNVLLDLGVVLLVVVLLAFEVMVVMISLSLTGPFNRLQYLADLQSLGDFSKYLGVRGRSAVDRLGMFLSERAEHLHSLFARAGVSSGELSEGSDQRKLQVLEKKFKLRRWRPQLLQFSYLNDIRLPLFLFAAADELPISFLPIYTRSVDNPLSWLDLGVVLSLPLAGYLLAIVLVSPIARPLAEKFGHRKLLLLAVIPTIIAHLGLYAATTTIEIIIFRTFVGMGFAVATLVCQDYVLDVVPKEMRNRSLGLFTAAMFGGVFAGTAIGGILADRLGPSLVFTVSAGLVAISGILLFQLIPKRGVSESTVPFSLRTAFPPIWRPLLSFRFSSLVFGIAVPANVLLQAFVSYLVALQLNALGASAADIGRVLMTYFLAIALVGPMAPRLFDRNFHPAQVGLFGSLISGCALCVAAIWPTYWAMLVAVAGAGIGHSLVRDTQVAVAMEIAETDLKHIGANTILGSLRTLERAGSILGLIGLALLSSYAGYTFTIGVISAWVLLGSAAFAFYALTWHRTSTPSNV